MHISHGSGNAVDSFRKDRWVLLPSLFFYTKIRLDGRQSYNSSFYLNETLRCS